MVTTRFLVLLLVAVGIAGCGCGIDAGRLGSITCATENDCLDGEVCADGYCQYEEAGGDADGDADGDGDGDGDADADGDGDGDADGCPGTEVRCQGDCFDLSSSVEHCGRCDRACDGDQTCADGRCEGSRCDPGLVFCDASQRCVDVSTDPDNCGRCEQSCGDGATCDSGNCGCPVGQTDCDAGGGTDCRVLDAGDPRNCGGCGVTCQAEEFCDAGQCTCRPGLTDECGGGCRSLATDPANCGSCDSPCQDLCQGGHCVSECPDGARECDGYCANTRTDPLNCGDCGNACAVDRLCVDGECRPFEVPLGCNTCPCDGCSEGFSRCCTYPGGSLPVCLDAESCP